MSFLHQTEFVAFDLETTGLNSRYHHIIELAAVRFRGDGQELGEFRQLVRPPVPISPEVIRVHGITNEDVRHQPTVIEVLPKFLAFIGQSSCIMMAHNAWFDLDFLWAACRHARLVPPALPVIDTRLLSRARLDLYSHKLESIARHLRLAQATRHRAAEDSRLLKHVFLRLVRLRPAISRVDELFDIAWICALDDRQRYVADVRQVARKLQEAIRRKRTLRIVYHGGRTPGIVREIEPIELYEHGPHLYVVARCHKVGESRTFRVDRVRIAVADSP